MLNPDSLDRVSDWTDSFDVSSESSVELFASSKHKTQMNKMLVNLITTFIQ